MREKLLLLMKNEGLKSGQFAEKVGVNAAGISHILAGRNKPGFDLLQKILRAFPHVNPDWLLLDSDQVYRDEPASPMQTPSEDELSFMNEVSEPKTPHAVQSPAVSASREEVAPLHHGSTKQVARVVILYTDGTCESYTPDK